MPYENLGFDASYLLNKFEDNEPINSDTGSGDEDDDTNEIKDAFTEDVMECIDPCYNNAGEIAVAADDIMQSRITYKKTLCDCIRTFTPIIFSKLKKDPSKEVAETMKEIEGVIV